MKTIPFTKCTIRITLCALLLPAFLLASDGQYKIVVKPGSKLWFDGNSTMHAFKSETKFLQVGGQVRVKPGTPTAAGHRSFQELAQVAELRGFRLDIPVKSLTSPTPGLADEIHKDLKADQFPQVSFTLLRYTVETKGNQLVLRATGLLDVAGEKKEISFPVMGNATGDTLHASGLTELLISDFKVKIPEMFFGALKVDNKLTIRWDLQLGIEALP